MPTEHQHLSGRRVAHRPSPRQSARKVGRPDQVAFECGDEDLRFLEHPLAIESGDGVVAISRRPGARSRSSRVASSSVMVTSRDPPQAPQRSRTHQCASSLSCQSTGLTTCEPQSPQTVRRLLPPCRPLGWGATVRGAVAAAVSACPSSRRPFTITAPDAADRHDHERVRLEGLARVGQMSRSRIASLEPRRPRSNAVAHPSWPDGA